ncbi:hypothetical protein DQ04_00471100 [Trypanosoma grayi]|uniref:hypothetical protein n=1 Tax=Trypanosoma grayi TaxID=71804 RepID=UPI0004F47272|nr:hypothetical protein DQ04_00471100 [Trypanosoma grayi]KEG14436.1 hypothetical protein DQ04_00471100 [Trypanosoma grayi]
MWRVSLVRRAAVVGGGLKLSSSTPRPYQRVLQMLQAEGEGLPAAGGVFDDFRIFYRQTMANASASSAQPKPLQLFCGASEDVEPFALLMMRVLCDLQKLEAVRFLFAQCVLELHTPSIELFNVYLLAISLTDTFNQYEIENVVEVMRTKKVEPDIVTRLSLFIVYMRLGQNYTTWWPTIHEEVLRIAKAGQRGQYPLLEVRLQHCFQTLLRIHHDVSMIQECFDLLKLIDKEKITSRLLLPYMLLSANNAATPPATTVLLLQMLEEARKLEATSSGSVAAEDHSVHANEETSVPVNSDTVLNNELTALKLMAKCGKWGDAASAAQVRQYLRDHPGVVSPTNEAVVALLYVEALARGGLLKEALTVLEEEVPAAQSQPGPRPKFFLESRRVTLLNADPIMTLVRLVAVGGANVEEALAFLEERHTAGSVVSNKSLNLLLEACVLLKDEGRASMVFAVFQSLGVPKTARTFLLLLLAFPDAASSVRRLPDMLTEMADCGVDVSPEFLRGALAVAIDAQDVAAAMQMVEYHERRRASIESKLAIRLMKLLCLVVDVESVRRLLTLLRATKSPVDPRSLSLCVATFRKWSIPCDDLVDA